MLQLMYTFHGLTAPDEILAGVRNGQISSFCLFAGHNVDTPMQVHVLCEQLYAAAAEGNQLPPLIGIDQEGGQLIAIENGTTELPGNMALGATRSTELAQKAGQVLGREMLALGINLNFAPAVDVNINPDNPVIGVRAFSDDPHVVSELGSALIRGLQNEGVIATAKHFPGHGDTNIDTHHAVPTIHHSLQQMQGVDLVPFQAAINADTQAIMTAHIMFSALDAENPATLSPSIIKDLLRNQLGFDGLVITDAMDMHAVAQFGTVESVERALKAGVDLALLGHIRNQLTLAPNLSIKENPASLARIQAARASVPTKRPELSVVGCAEHRAIAQEIADASITVVRNRQLPLQTDADQTIAVITPRPEDLTPADTSSHVKIRLAEHIRDRHPMVQAIEIDHMPNDTQIVNALAMTTTADIVVVGTIAADQSEGQQALIHALVERGQYPIVVAMRTPYDLAVLPMIDTYLCSYSIRPVSMKAVAKVLFGEIEAKGVLPSAIPGVVQ